MRKFDAPFTLKAMAAAVALSFTASASAGQTDKGTTADVDIDVDRAIFSDEEWRDLAYSSLAVRVQSNLAESASLRGADITVEVDDDGKVTLEGEVMSERQKQRAVRIAENTPGVRTVDDDLDVDENMELGEFEQMDDQKLARKVANTIASKLGNGAKVEEDWFFGFDVKGKSKDGDEWELDVEADEGEIELDGELPRNADLQEILQAVRRIPAVRSIDNDIHVEEQRHLAYAPDPYRPYGIGYHPYGYPYPATLVSASGSRELICQFADASAVENTQASID